MQLVKEMDNCESHCQKRKITKTDNLTCLSKNERFLIIDRVDAIARNDLCSEASPYGVCRKSKHIHLDVRTDLLLRQKLTCNYLIQTDTEASDVKHRGQIYIYLRVMSYQTFTKYLVFFNRHHTK